MTLLELIKDGLKEGDKKIIPQLDFNRQPRGCGGLNRQSN